MIVTLDPVQRPNWRAANPSMSFNVLLPGVAMKLKPLAAAALLATSLSSFAATDLGTLGTDPVFFNGTGSGFVFDTFTFTLSELSNLRIDVTDLKFPSSWSFSNLGIALLDESFATLGSATAANGLSFSGLAAGTYALALTGFTNGTYGGAYAGVLAAAPVPEPETYALMLAGLGIVGFIASRRRSNV
ncbi:hypothetical protein CLD22_10525 [Rubrivivax gelatinosus]|nr:hypothetical protein [Rubrivivax gelatinosus]